MFKTIAAILLIVAVAFAAGCKKDTAEPNTGGDNGGGNGGGGSTLTEEGIYLGVIGFNDDLYTKDISLLNNSTKQGFKTFISNLTTANGTGLYYADYVALENLKSSQEPPKLTNVVLVTFTDGLDNVSIGPSLPNPGNYNTDEEYRNALHNKIKNDIVHGKHINAYTIGLKGLDAQADIETFRANLKKLASDDKNVYEAENMDEALSSFAEIAESLHSISTNSKLMLKVPGGYNSGNLIRFTFDNITSIENSNLYIEGTYTKNSSGLIIENITYHGFKPGVTSLASVGVEGSYYQIVFENLTKTNGELLTQTDINLIKLWQKKSTNWVPETEFTPSGSTQVIEEQSSALIMLVLDCTTSLGNDFNNMKTAAKQFVETLISPNGGGGGGGTATTPTVTTNSVSDITSSTAKCGGNVTSDGGESVTARGVCWSTNQNPTTNSSHVSAGSGTGSFTANMTGLSASTTYYVRAYATNSKGTSYGEQKTFTTTSGGGGGGSNTAPVVTTSSVTNITQNSAKCGGNVTSDGGATVTERGICWSTSSNPTINSNHVSSGSGTGSFTANMTGLNANTTYYVRAYAKNSIGTSYGEQKSFKTEANSISGWLYYGASNNHQTCWGLTNGGDIEWAVMFPTATLSQYSGTSITKVKVYIGDYADYTVKIYRGGTNAPTTLLYVEDYYVSEDELGWNTFELSDPVQLNTNYTLWVAVATNNYAGYYPMGVSAGCGNKNARWFNYGDGWVDFMTTNNNQDITFEIQAFVTNGVKGIEGLEIQLPQTPVNNDSGNTVKVSYRPY